ncbi:MAG TPA: dienelactone hydrolase family protein [Verrucomicrobiae bacterium]
MKKIQAILLLPLLLGLSACNSLKPSAFTGSANGQTAQHFSQTQTQTLTTDYLLYLPADYTVNSGKRWPMIFFLHGAGERGTNVWMVAKHGPAKIATQTTNFPFIVVSPLCPEGKIWSNDLLLRLLDDVEKKYAVDLHRVYLTGLSMGGFGTWDLALEHPEKFAAIAPISGGGETLLVTLAKFYDPEKLAELKRLPIWAFHGGQDPVVATTESEHMVKALKNIGCTNVQLTIYPEAKHDAWTQTYANPALFDWFLQHSR